MRRTDIREEALASAKVALLAEAVAVSIIFAGAVVWFEIAGRFA